jgi:hypothetical protein
MTLKAISVQAIILIFALGTSACAEAKKPDIVSLIPILEAMRPVMTCIGEAKQGDSKAAEVCAKNGGIALTSGTSEPPNLNDLKLQFVATWLYFDQDPARRMSIADFDGALDFAQCIEKTAFADPAFSSRTERGVAAARIRADAACREHPLSMMRVSPELVSSGKTIENAAQIMLARSLSGLSLNYALETNGLITDAMRPCVRYSDGRPPSRGCMGKPQSEAFSPPPSPSTNR